MAFGKRKQNEDVGGSVEEQQREDLTDDHEDDLANAGEGDGEEESAEQGAENSAKQPFLDENKEKKGVSKTVVTKMYSPLAEAFGATEIDSVDLKIMEFITVNGIPFDAMRSPRYYEMVSAIKQAPMGYKPPSYEEARTTLLDACKANVEKELAPVRGTWYAYFNNSCDILFPTVDEKTPPTERQKITKTKK